MAMVDQPTITVAREEFAHENGAQENGAVVKGAPPAPPSDGQGPPREALLKLIEDASNPALQAEASRLVTAVVDLGPTPNAGDLTLIQSAVSALTAKSANIEVSKFVRNRLEIASRNRKRGLVPLISRKLSDSPVYAMLVGALASGVIWAIGFAAIIIIGGYYNKLEDTTFILPVREAGPLAFAAFVGGLVSLLSRVEEFANLYIFDPFLVFLNSFLKPLIGTVLAITIYAIVKSGLIHVNGLDLDDDGGYRFIFWAFGFLAGFSERLTGDFIARAETVVGGTGDKKEASPS